MDSSRYNKGCCHHLQLISYEVFQTFLPAPFKPWAHLHLYVPVEYHERPHQTEWECHLLDRGKKLLSAAIKNFNITELELVQSDICNIDQLKWTKCCLNFLNICCQLPPNKELHGSRLKRQSPTLYMKKTICCKNLAKISQEGSSLIGGSDTSSN